MSNKNSNLKIVGARSNHLIVTSESFEKFIVHKFYPNSKQNIVLSALLKSKSNCLIPILTHNLISNNQPSLCKLPQQTESVNKITIVTKFYQSTLEQMITKRGTFDQEQLINTAETIIQLLQELSSQNCPYGMLKPNTICFYQGEIKLGFGQVTQRKFQQTSLQTDLRSLGEMILKLSTSQGDQMSNLLQKASKKYSSKLIELIRKLINPVSIDRRKVFTIHNQTQQIIENIDKPCSLTLGQSNLRSTTQAMTDRIDKIKGIVNEYLKRSKKVLERSENSQLK